MTLDDINSEMQQSFSKRLFEAKLEAVSLKLNQPPVFPIKLLATDDRFEAKFKNIEAQIIDHKKTTKLPPNSSSSDISKYLLLSRSSSLTI
jgi:hypothetical protein